ncbi:MAG: hypothetical protein ACJ754_12835 [Pyrinomonadaceae bacterium]
MFDLNATLDNLIAMVVVLLALSLVVQAVQAAVKKMFKLKSRQIEDSLAHLFQFVINNETVVEQEMQGRWAWFNRIKAMVAQSPFLRIFTTIAHPADRAMEYDPEYEPAANLHKEVMKKFKGIGRVAFSARPIFDSLSKGDLMKVVASVDPEAVDKSFVGNFAAAVERFGAVYKTFVEWEDWFKGPEFAALDLGEEDKQRLADMQAKLAPLLSHLRLLLTGDSAGGPAEIKAPPANVIKQLAADIAGLRSVNLEDAQKVIDDAAANVAQAAARARAKGQADVAEKLSQLAAGVAQISAGFAAFRKSYAAVFARWSKLEESFDSVMQSFEERYTRGMKTAALVISFLVVVFLNANFFNVYTEISTSDAKRELIIQSRPQVVEALARNLPAPPSPPPPPPNETADQKAERGRQEQAARDAREAATRQTVQTWLKASEEEIGKSAETFVGYGFTPITLQETEAWLSSLVTRADWWPNRKHDLRVLLGWVVMALLLSVGAPFWQDFLESLFGVKNVLRKRSDTKNVEQESGAGQPRQS